MVFARFVVSSLNGVWLKLGASFDFARASLSGLHACSLELSLDSCVLWADDLVPVYIFKLAINRHRADVYSYGLPDNQASERTLIQKVFEMKRQTLQRNCASPLQ